MRTAHTRRRILEKELQQQYARVHDSLSSPHSCIPSTLHHHVLEYMVQLVLVVYLGRPEERVGYEYVWGFDLLT